MNACVREANFETKCTEREFVKIQTRGETELRLSPDQQRSTVPWFYVGEGLQRIPIIAAWPLWTNGAWIKRVGSGRKRAETY